MEQKDKEELILSSSGDGMKETDIMGSENMEGGFLSKLGFGNSFTRTVKKTKTSETKLIEDYEKMDKVIKDYNKTYTQHLKNLETLDDYANFNGMEKLFKKVILKHEFRDGKVDKSSPLLFRNYLIQSGTAPSAFRKEHIMRQIEYVLSKSFPGREAMFIKHMQIDLGKTEFILYATTIENVKKSRKIAHSDYMIDMSGTKQALKDIIESTKKNVRRKSTVLTINSLSIGNGDGSSKSSKRSSKKSGSKSKKSSIGSFFSKTRKSSRDTGNGSDKLPSRISLGTYKTRRSTAKEPLSRFQTPSPQVATATIPSGISALQPPSAITFGQPISAGIEEKKADLLGTPQMQTQVSDPIIAKCQAYTDYNACKGDKDCYYNMGAQRCFKSTRPPLPQMPNFGIPSPLSQPQSMPGMMPQMAPPPQQSPPSLAPKPVETITI